MGNFDAAPALPALAELRPIRELQRELAHLFPSQNSIDWQIRVHRRRYIESGALFMIADRLVVHMPTFSRVTLEIATEKALARARLAAPGATASASE